MDTVMIKCNELMVGDWVALNPNFPMQIVDAGDDYAYATWEGNEGDPWEFCDKEGYEPKPIILTPEILEKNGWNFGLTPFGEESSEDEDFYDDEDEDEDEDFEDEEDSKKLSDLFFKQRWSYNDTGVEIALYSSSGLKSGSLCMDARSAGSRNLRGKYIDFMFSDNLYVHELQHVLRLCGLTDLANNFKVI